MREKRNGFKNTKLGALGVRAILLIHCALWPHQPLLVSTVLVISKRQPLLRLGILGNSKHGATTGNYRTCDEVMEGHGA